MLRIIFTILLHNFNTMATTKPSDILRDIVGACSKENYMSMVMKAPFIYSDELVIGLSNAGGNMKELYKGETIYIWACKNGKLGFLKFLLREGGVVSLDDTNKKKENALIMAAENGHTNCVKFLIEKGIPVDIRGRSNPKRGTSALMSAVSRNHVDTSRILLENGAAIESSYCEKTPLLVACTFGSTECLNLLISLGADVSAKYKNKPSLLIAAENYRRDCMGVILNQNIELDKFSYNAAFTCVAVKGKHSCVKTILDHEKSSKNPYEKEKVILNLLHNTKSETEYDNLETIDVILGSGGVDINTTDSHGRTPLMLAIKNSLPSLAVSLVEQGCDVKRVDAKSRNAMNYFITASGGQGSDDGTSGDIMLKILLENGCDINDKICAIGDTALIVAIKRKYYRFACNIIDKGADVDKFNNDGYNAIMSCMLDGGEDATRDMIAKIISNGANVNVKNEKGNTPLMCLLKSGDAETINRILENGGDVSIKDKKGRNGLHLASVRTSKVLSRVIESCVKFKVNMNTEDRNGNTAMAYALGSKWSNVRMILENGGNPNIKDLNGQTALMSACKTPDTAMVSLFLEKGALVNYKNDKKETALMIACEAGNIETVKLLVENGANVNTENRYLKTALMICVQENQLDIAQYLVDSGADIRKSYLVLGNNYMSECSDSDSDN